MSLKLKSAERMGVFRQFHKSFSGKPDQRVTGCRISPETLGVFPDFGNDWPMAALRWAASSLNRILRFSENSGWRRRRKKWGFIGGKSES